MLTLQLHDLTFVEDISTGLPAIYVHDDLGDESFSQIKWLVNKGHTKVPSIQSIIEQDAAE